MLKMQITIDNPGQILPLILEKVVTVYEITGRRGLVLGQFYTHENDPTIYAEPAYIPWPYCLPFYWYARLCKWILK